MNGTAPAMPGVSGGRLKLMVLNRLPCSMNINNWLRTDQRAYPATPGTAAGL